MIIKQTNDHLRRKPWKLKVVILLHFFFLSVLLQNIFTEGSAEMEIGNDGKFF